MQRQLSRNLKRKMHNSCCFCMTIGSGVNIIAALGCIFYIGIVIWTQAMDPEDIGGIRLDDIFNGFGNMLLTICILMILANILLLVSSTTKQPYILLPWIIANFIIGFILLGLELFYFPILDMSYDEYVTIMVSNAVFIIMTAFFWIVVVFMFQININRDPSQTDPTETLGTWMRKKFKNKL